MKKIVFIFGIFALSACGEDVYQQIDEQNSVRTGTAPEEAGGGNAINTFDNGIPGHSVPGVPGAFGPYGSPVELTVGGIMFYLINNTPHTLIITPHIGFAIWGTEVDNYWSGGAGASTFQRLFKDGPNDKQYGNTFTTAPVKLSPWTSVTHGPSTGRFPLNGASWGSSFWVPSTYPEIGAMQEAGKIYFIEYEVIDAAGTSHNGVLKQKIGNDTMTLGMIPPNWQHIIPVFPSTSTDLTYNSDLALIYQDALFGGAPGSGSQEICLVNHPGTTIVPSEVIIAGNTLSFVTDLSGVYIIFQ